MHTGHRGVNNMKHSGDPVKILFVDDEENVLKSLRRLFLDDDYEILMALSGEKGLETLRENEPVEIVVSDYRMPGMNGVDFLKQVYAGWPDTVRIVLSGYADTASVVDAINEGHIYKFVPKPWNDDELKVTISNAIDHYLLKMQNKELARELKDTNDELQAINQNLELLVDQRTNELLFQNEVLKMSQNILNALPVGVIGMDPAGLIVQINQGAEDILGIVSGKYLGINRIDVLSEDMNALIEKAFREGFSSGKVLVNGTDVEMKCSVMKHVGQQEGIVAVMIREDN